ncbi:MAG: hypothetical protein GWO08_23485 [Gammaproteobacteria bacterium]|nr:hypothetical protein [Gammaproteobacteria bacterium]NIR96485.1 hypothetical protein [Gammaproteobacteria bacterium]
MKKHFISIILLLLSLFAVTSAHARLTLGVVVDSEGNPGLMQSSQLDNLVAQLHETLQEEIIVKEMPDAATVIDWLDQYAALDMALLSQEAVNAFRGRVLFVGAIDKGGQVNLVARQGGNAEVTEKVARFVKSAGFSPWRPAGTDSDTFEVFAEAPPEGKELRSIDDVIEAVADGGPPTTSYEAREPLLLAVIPELKGVLQSTAEAEQLAGYLESTLPVEVKVKEFDQVDQFAEWFMRFRMVDLAVVSKSLAETKLGRDYIAIAAFEPEGVDVGAAELLVGRRGHKASLQNQLKQVLLNAQQSVFAW